MESYDAFSVEGERTNRACGEGMCEVREGRKYDEYMCNLLSFQRGVGYSGA